MNSFDIIISSSYICAEWSHPNHLTFFPPNPTQVQDIYICSDSEVVKTLPWQCAAAEGHHVVMVAQGTGWGYHLHLSAGSLQIGQGWLSVGGASCQSGLWLVGGQRVGGGPRDDGLWLAGSEGLVTCYGINGRVQVQVSLEKREILYKNSFQILVDHFKNILLHPEVIMYLR